MNHVFCTECGSKIEYSYSKPKFCSSCGNKCDSVSKNGASATRESKNQEVEESLADDETSINELPNISRLEVETESYGNNVFSFESLIGEKDQNPRVRNKGSRSLEDFIDDRRDQ